jgi:hypothetical protein
MRSSGLRGHSIVFPDVLSARSRLTRRWALGLRVRSSLLRQPSSSRLRTLWSFATRHQCECVLSRQAVSFPASRKERNLIADALPVTTRRVTSAHSCGHARSSGSGLPETRLRTFGRSPAARLEDRRQNQSTREREGKLFSSVRWPRPTMRSSGLRGHIIVFPAVLSARSRLTRRWALGLRVRLSLRRQFASSCFRTFGPFAIRHQWGWHLLRQAVSFPASRKERNVRASAPTVAARRFTSTHICDYASSSGSKPPESWVQSDYRSPEARHDGTRQEQSSRAVEGKLSSSVRWPRPTMRSSGPRGESIVFPDVLSARGRLTRR